MIMLAHQNMEKNTDNSVTNHQGNILRGKVDFNLLFILK